MATRLDIEGGRPLAGHVTAPPDKSIVHRALILAALGRGPAEVVTRTMGADNRATARVLSALGVPLELHGAGATVEGVGGPLGLRAPTGHLDCDNSGTTLRLMCGVLAASRLTVTLTGDASLVRRPMDRLAPLVSMGARLEGQGERARPPITVTGGPLVGRVHRLPIASAQVKSAVLLAGLWADGATVVYEPSRSRDHTERMLRALGASVVEQDDGGLVVTPLVEPWRCAQYVVPPDPSSAAFLWAAAVLTGSPGVVVRAAVNPTRTGALDVLAALGAEVQQVALPSQGGEPMADVTVRVPAAGLRGATIAGALTLRSIDEIPLLSALAAFVPGRTVVRDAAELRVKESDRLTATAQLIRAFGGVAEETADGLVIDGDPARLRAAEVDGGLDHRIAMTAAVLALGARGRSSITGMEVADVSFPDFARTLEALGAAARER